jgi:hypothetical protein
MTTKHAKKQKKTARSQRSYEFEEPLLTAPFSFHFLCTLRHSHGSGNLRHAAPHRHPERSEGSPGMARK